MSYKDRKTDLLKSYTLDEIKDQVIGVKGTPDRDAYEATLYSELQKAALKRNRKRKWTT